MPLRSLVVCIGVLGWVGRFLLRSRRERREPERPLSARIQLNGHRAAVSPASRATFDLLLQMPSPRFRTSVRPWRPEDAGARASSSSGANERVDRRQPAGDLRRRRPGGRASSEQQTGTRLRSSRTAPAAARSPPSRIRAEGHGEDRRGRPRKRRARSADRVVVLRRSAVRCRFASPSGPARPCSRPLAAAASST